MRQMQAKDFLFKELAEPSVTWRVGQHSIGELIFTAGRFWSEHGEGMLLRWHDSTGTVADVGGPKGCWCSIQHKAEGSETLPKNISIECGST